MAWDIYDLLIDKIQSDIPIQKIVLGLSWSFAEAFLPNQENSIGLCFSPTTTSRILDWPGTTTQRKTAELACWIKSWDAAQAVVGLAAINAVINASAAALNEAIPIINTAPGHLKVFAHFKSRIINKKITVIGRYPGLDKIWSDISYRCIERNPQAGDLPDTAAEYILPESEWVFITASSIANKSLPRLLELSRNAQIVLMGPSLPWMHEWTEFGVDYLAGVKINNPTYLQQVVAEGGGTRLFDGGVEYCIWGDL